MRAADRFAQYGLSAGADFSPLSVKTGGRPRTDYLLTIDTAKELSMVERTERGRQTRRYLIAMEKAVREMAAEKTAQGLSVPSACLEAHEAFARLEDRLAAIENRLLAKSSRDLPFLCSHGLSRNAPHEL